MHPKLKVKAKTVVLTGLCRSRPGVVSAALLLLTLLAAVGAAAAPVSSTSSREVRRAHAPGAPKAVHGAAGSNNTSIKVTWQAAAANGAPVTAYKVKWRTGSTSPKTAQLGSGARSYTVPKLTAGRTYQVSVLAHNKVGWGPASKQLPVTLGDSPLRDYLQSITSAHPAVGSPGGNTLYAPAANFTLRLVPHLYPGAVISGDPNQIVNGQLTPIALATNGGTLTLTGIQLDPSQGGGATVNAHVKADDEPNVTQAIQNLRGQKSFKTNAINTTSITYDAVSSSEQAALKANASYEYKGVGSLSDQFNEADNTNESHVLYRIDQTFYSVSYKPDTPAGSRSSDLDAFFAPDVTPAEAKQHMSNSAPPMYVSNVVYGTRFFFLASSRASISQIENTLNATWSLIGSGSGSLTTSQKTTLDEMQISVAAIGGNGQAIGDAIAGVLGHGGKDVQNWLAKYAQESLTTGAAAAVPISYQLSYLDNAVVGEYWPTYTPPKDNDGDLVDHLNMTVDIGTDDKECQTPVDVTLATNTGLQLWNTIIAGNGGPNGQNACKVKTPLCTGGNNPNDYWNNAQSGQGPITCKIPFPKPIPLWQIAGSQLTVTGAGDSWHAGFEVTFDLTRSGANPDGAYYGFTTTRNMFFNVDRGNGNPCEKGFKAQGYTMTLLEPGDNNATIAQCPSAGIPS